ncbi:MAG: hypothetical protein JXA92_03475 [candidate division Zixibacteria bacterium]|nr:hypothetical protein [candidate division Zixibacteria bacterium]
MPEEEPKKLLSYSIKTGEKAALTYISPILHIRLGINPARAENKDDKFRLFSSDGKYDKTLTVKDDKVDGDEFVDLIYDNLKIALKYTLEIDPGAEGEKYNLFEEVPYLELIDYYSMLEPDDELEEEEEDEEEEESEEAEYDWEDEEDGGGEFGGDTDDDSDDMEKILESEEPEEEKEIDWDSFDPVKSASELEPGFENEDDDEDATPAGWN